MPIKGNQFRSNTAKSGNLNNGQSTRRAAPKRVGRSEQIPNLRFSGSKIAKIIGLFLLLLSIYFLVAFVSYLFTWQEDQSYVSFSNGGWSNLLKSQEELIAGGVKDPLVENWLGKFGALLAHQFIYKWFGIASFIFLFVFFAIGHRLLFRVRLFSLLKALGYSFFFLIFISVTLGYFHSFLSNYPHFLEGEFGFWTNRLLQVQLGNAGVGGLLVFAALTFMVIAYNLDFKLPERRSRDDKPESIKDDFEAIISPDYKSEQIELNPKFNERKEDTPLSHATVAKQKEVVIDKELTLTAERNSVVVEEEEDTKLSPNLAVEEVVEEKKADANVLVEKFGQYDPQLDLSSYKFPHLGLLRDYGTGKIVVNSAELEANKDRIVETLGNYNIEIEKIKATIGPTVTLYEIVPKPGVRISRIKNLEDDIALSLAALGIRIIAPMPGKGTIGIEVPNSQPEMVSMRSVIATEKFQHTDMDLPIAFGKTITNEVFIADLAKMPHLLVAGATGQGKSVGINAIITSLLFKRHPAELKFVLVDPKKVELSLFNTIERHFLAKLPGEEDAIITDTKKVINTLNSLCIEMDLRYDLLKNAGVRNLKEYNAKFVNRRLNPEEGHRFLPFIVLIVDEFADLMMTAGKEIEAPIARLAQLARAVGIHLVIATQRPSVNIITGTIKANFPARLAFRVLSRIDSRTILDTGGADQLIGRGDMLLSTGSDLIRIQCAFVDTPEVEAISEYIGSQRGYSSAFLLPEYVDENSKGTASDSFGEEDRDSLFEDAARLIVLHQQGSTSLIQRKLKLGYNRAGRIIDQLEQAGIVGQFEGSKAREVLYPDEGSLERYLDTLRKEG
ncbi:FtsK/SpoIIIE family DNA translocase [Albibacterium bauzanense]|uniref:S-DNA-T family DNA segregation ATPase FtsK/SpoIIIE n=1 Tax=Albibacterium bauzanense TaxID=653929 RepID=A0A4V2PY64_9SPHI|nr:DNA translocase FtsK [Albibacterium bauzanense]TCK84801.1 S-DNA-T family DNA segregation ATPase FtsK/SpoIIIE [Albibacterium bauzanense]